MQTVIEESIKPAILSAVSDKLNVESIYLFGSRARGDFKPNSDYDVYVVLSDTPKQDLYEIEYGICENFFKCDGLDDVSIDILVNYKDIFDARSKEAFAVESEVIRDGVKIYG